MARREAWMHAMDVQLDTFKWGAGEGALYNLYFMQDLLQRVAGDTDNQGNPVTDSLLAEAATELWQMYQGCLWKSDTIFVTSDMLHLLMTASESLPEDAKFDEHVLITENGFALFHEPIVGTDRSGGRVMFHGMCWTTRMILNHDTMEKEKGVYIFFLVDPNDPDDDYNAEFVDMCHKIAMPVPPLALQHFFFTPFGREIGPATPDMVGSVIVHQALRLFLSMQLMAQQKIGEPIHLRPDRATRKRVQREWQVGDRLITLITLRRKTVKKDKEEPGKVEWSRRWLVKGHWRLQYYPKSKTHDYIYIADFIKGPEDKPFITGQRVFNFRR